ncbi:MAG: GNAT family N-acetyltransferase [Solibacillus sp.]
MEFTLKAEGTSGAYEYVKEGEHLAEITWQLKDGVMHMDHTYVSNELRGQGVAKKLLDEAANYAREQDYKMNALCSYVVAEFEKSDEYNDVKA